MLKRVFFTVNESIDRGPIQHEWNADLRQPGLAGSRCGAVAAGDRPGRLALLERSARRGRGLAGTPMQNSGFAAAGDLSA